MGRLGYKHTEEAKERIRQSLIGNKRSLGQKHSADTIAKRSMSMRGVHTGRKHSDEARLHMSLAHLGKKQSAESSAKRSVALRGKKLPPRSEEYRMKMSEAKKGTVCPEHVREIVSRLNKGMAKSAETRKRMSQAQRARATENNFYIDGRSSERSDERAIACRSFEYKEWRRAVFSRDSYSCQMCSQLSGELHADHIKSWAAYPELRYTVENGRTLCASCHRKTPTYGRHPSLIADLRTKGVIQ